MAVERDKVHTFFTVPKCCMGPQDSGHQTLQGVVEDWNNRSQEKKNRQKNKIGHCNSPTKRIPSYVPHPEAAPLIDSKLLSKRQTELVWKSKSYIKKK